MTKPKDIGQGCEKLKWLISADIINPLATASDHLIRAINISSDFDCVGDQLRHIGREPFADVDDLEVNVCVVAV